ncbi:hypothetical protein MMB92_27290 [Burkholderia sp. IO2]|uniref:hypothetical protein n=1 Tax=Burkholderia sp. IO2 TaxID=2917805 RepID=UPI00240653F9|nr:hypothetical protein [Burkholderia sp. IO2]MDG0067670.1 hypothetical protein [Burkholderia sp. IO2]
MSAQEFIDAPWQESHRVFENSVFNIRPAPEFSTGEVVLSSLYRASGFKDVTEKQVKGLGDELRKAADKASKKEGKDGAIQPDTWRTVLDRLVQSPKVSQQSSKRFMSLSPVVPDTALYSGAPRLSGNPWNPGQLVKRIIQIGASSNEAATKVWQRLHEALCVDTNDDVWACWLQEEFELRRIGSSGWQSNALPFLEGLPSTDRTLFQYPAKQFVADLGGIISAKAAMTRRQWISLLEAVLRIGTVSHVLWLCDVSDRIWRVVRGVMEGTATNVPTSEADVVSQMLAVKRRMLSFGHPAHPTLRDYASKYLSARLGLNRVLWALEDMGVPVTNLNSVAEILAFLGTIRAQRERLTNAGIMDSYHELHDREIRTIACKKGVGANLMEFALYTLGQRQTMDETLRGYDQGYFLRKRGRARNAPWFLTLGPASVLAMAHCCLHEVNGPRSVQRLAMHLASYGIEFDLHGLNDSELGRQLRMLSLVLDSPDAESGMLLVPPFAN